MPQTPQSVDFVKRLQPLLYAIPAHLFTQAEAIVNDWENVELDARIQHNLRGGGKLNRRSGALAQGYRTRTVIKKDKRSTDITIKGTVVGSAAAYAIIQDEGGTIKAKTGKYLAIPTRWALTGDSPTGTIRAAYVSSRGLRGVFKKSDVDIDNYGRFFATAKVGSKKGKRVQLFTLKQRVTLHGTGWYSDAIAKTARTLITRLSKLTIKGAKGKP